ncbi:MAG: FAD-dependent monooxygenase [Bacteroidota bacterium]
MESTKVLIIGAGPSGMISALCLAKLGIACTIVERNTGINDHPKAHELNTRSIEILKELGITDAELAAEASPLSDGARILFCNTINEEFGRIDLNQEENRRDKYKRHLRSDRPYLNISQTALEKIILKKVKAHPLIKVYFNHQWRSLEETSNGVESIILNRASESLFRLRSQFVIAADGANSRCRRFLGIEMEGPDNIQDFASAYFETNLRDHVITPAKLYWIFNPLAPGIFIAHHIEKRWVYMLPIYLPHQQKEQFTKSFFEQRIKAALGNSDLAIKVKSVSFWRMSAQLAKAYHQGRTFLVGDAAHRFPPTGGLGMNTGIADAHNLCWKLAAVLQGTAATQLLTTYEQERRPIAAQNTAESLHNYHKILDVPNTLGLDTDGLERLAKLQASAPLKWLPPFIKHRLIKGINTLMARRLKRRAKDRNLKLKIRQTIAEQIPHFDRIGLDIGYIYEKGALLSDGTTPRLPADQVTEYLPSTHPGARFPHLSLSPDGAYQSTHDFLSYHQFTLLVREEGQAWVAAYDQFARDNSVTTKLLQLHQLDLSPSVFEQLVKLCELSPAGALLIRPDGHVAFRAKAYPPNNFALRPLFDRLLQNKINQYT